MSDTPARTDAPAPAAAPAPAPAGPPCQNCGTPLLGEHCYACGQPVKGMVRHFGTILGDFFDSVLDLDSRIFRTLWPLFAKPGYLTLEYFAGRRVRYVTPVRLFVFLSVVTFFVAQMVVQLQDNEGPRNAAEARIAAATTVADVQRLRDAALKPLQASRDTLPDNPAGAGARVGLDMEIARLRTAAEQRIAQLERRKAAGKPPPDEATITFGDSGPWDPVTNPVTVSWLPGFANAWINGRIGHAQDNIARMQQDQSLLKDAMLGAVPSTLFVLVPVFALMLKVLYLFRRRLYMEHLLVALHSHAFLCLALLLVFLATALGEGVPALATLTGSIEGGLFVWMLVYLLLMQKRVYGQGWPMTLFKYTVLGSAYMVLLGFGALAAVVIGLAWG
ncbi:MAG TPA: DUF3667 domain-containing protein [Xanthomonadaceae bacterium]|nr:DUF3667 domain-containing protein [Xanthomonadaceae bacterium]